jgi:hypothetical protein
VTPNISSAVAQFVRLAGPAATSGAFEPDPLTASIHCPRHVPVTARSSSTSAIGVCSSGMSLDRCLQDGKVETSCEDGQQALR